MLPRSTDADPGAEFQQTFNDLTGQGYRLADISGYDYQGADRYACIFVKD